nr:YiaA/YiaB family inner membrane protein [Xanthomonas populi]
MRTSIANKPSEAFVGASWVALLLGVGLFNATLTLSEKGVYAMAYALSLFAAMAVQKNSRDNAGTSSEPPGLPA